MNKGFIDFFLHLDKYMVMATVVLGAKTYWVLFLIVFAETGLIVTPFLPGDSLLFAAGAVAALEDSVLNVHLFVPLLILAAFVGDAVNYFVGKRVGPKIFQSEKSFLFNVKHLKTTQEFYDRHGKLTIILARFVPIVRTFAPFVAGIGQMNYRIFAAYNLIGAILWVMSLSYAGYFFGQIPLVKQNFEIVILAIIGISVMPMVIAFLRERMKAGASVANISK